ncbi:MAG: phage gp6-like head-tail connector protein [Clostridia bacterium]|nr:phage gp6-like head-tail connector protein [Clostridia bacterium]
MAETETTTYVPVSIEEVCDFKGFLVEEVEQDAVVKRNIIRLIKFSNLYLQGAIGKNYPTDDERAKQIALLVISDLYDYRELDSKNISNTTRKILNDLEWQLKVELRNKSSESEDEENGDEQTD